MVVYKRHYRAKECGLRRSFAMTVATAAECESCGGFEVNLAAFCVGVGYMGALESLLSKRTLVGMFFRIDTDQGGGCSVVLADLGQILAGVLWKEW